MAFQPDFWHWIILAVLLLIVEALAPGAFFLWMGVAAGVVGLLLLAIPGLGLEFQILIFAVVSVVSVVAWRSYLRSHPTESDKPLLNRRGEQYVNRTFTLTEPIVNGQGKIRVDDSTWKISGEDCAAGIQVTVVGVDGVVLRVERG
ncbi:MAG: NfeD family protein [Gammaproteobacteria bacterium]|nr:NfeD family protein [Gammaproteobacteria bacterium]